MVNILGLNIGHPDASACLVIDGELAAAIAKNAWVCGSSTTVIFQRIQ